MVTLLFSCAYASNQTAVTSGNHVKMCKWLPWKPRLIRLWRLGNTGNHGNHYFFIYIRFFVWTHDRQSRYNLKPPERQHRTAGRIGQTPVHETACDCWCYNPTIFHSLAEMPQTAPKKFWLWQIYGIFYGIIDLPKNKIYLNQYDMLSFRERPCRF